MVYFLTYEQYWNVRRGTNLIVDTFFYPIKNNIILLRHFNVD